MISLGNPDVPGEYWKEIVNLVEGRLYQQPKLLELFPPEVNREEIQEWADTIVRRIELQGKWQSLSACIKQKEPESAIQAEAIPNTNPESVIDGVLADLASHQSTAMLGPVLVGLSAWNQLNMDGCLKTQRLWKLYITMTRAEDGFRMLKGNLGLHPNFHQLEHRVDAHVFITILAYQLLQTILYPLQRAGDHRSWESIRRVLETHCYTTMLLPTVQEEMHRIRKAEVPDERQSSIYRQLHVDLTHLPMKRSVSPIRSTKS